MNFERTERRRKSIQLTSLIDIMFLLVVFFMLTSKFITISTMELNVSTVEDSSKNKENQQPAIIIELQPKSKFIMDGQTYGMDELGNRLGKMLQADKGREVVLTSKDNVSVQDMVTAMDRIRQSGGSNISLAK